MSRAEDALMRLYEDADLRDELTDDEAETLLKWAETQLTQLDTPALDDETFETQVDTLMRLIKQMNRYAGRQGQGFAAQGVDETPGKIAALASALGRATDADQIAAAGTGEPGSTVAALTAMLSPASPSSSTAPPRDPSVTPASDPVVSPGAPEPSSSQPSSDASTELRETPIDDNSTVEAQAAAWVRDRAAAFGRWLHPDADTDRDSASADSDTDANRDGSPADEHTDSHRDAR